MVGDRRQAAAAVDQDRHPALRGELEDGREAVVRQKKALRTGMELDAPGARIEAASRLLDRALREVEANEWNEPPVRSLGIGERAVVRRAERRPAIRLVEAEHETARDAVAVEQPAQLVVVAPHAVDVVPRCRCASKISALSGSSRRTSASYSANRSCARARTSPIGMSLRRAITGEAMVLPSTPLYERAGCRLRHRRMPVAWTPGSETLRQLDATEADVRRRRVDRLGLACGGRVAEQ